MLSFNSKLFALEKKYNRLLTVHDYNPDHIKAMLNNQEYTELALYENDPEIYVLYCTGAKSTIQFIKNKQVSKVQISKILDYLHNKYILYTLGSEYCNDGIYDEYEAHMGTSFHEILNQIKNVQIKHTLNFHKGAIVVAQELYKSI